MVRLPPLHTVRGQVKNYLHLHADQLRATVLEVGARNRGCWWADYRDLRPELDWCGVDLEAGPGVDQVADFTQRTTFTDASFGSAICSEVLEHVKDPLALLTEIRRVLRPGGAVLLTTLFAFPYHGFPDDYWRFTDSGLALLLHKAGFSGVECSHSTRHLDAYLDNHGDGGRVHQIPIHTFGRGHA